MTMDLRNHRFSKPAIAVAAVVGLSALTLPLTSAKAQVPYFGVDLGNGVSVGVGVPAPVYGWGPYYSPYYSPYHYPRYYYPHGYYYRW